MCCLSETVCKCSGMCVSVVACVLWKATDGEWKSQVSKPRGEGSGRVNSVAIYLPTANGWVWA